MTVNSDVNTLGSNLCSRMQELSNCTTVQAVKDFVKDCTPEKKANEPKVRSLYAQLDKCKTVEKAYFCVTNFVLAGDNLKTIKIK